MNQIFDFDLSAFYRLGTSLQYLPPDGAHKLKGCFMFWLKATLYVYNIDHK